MTTNKPLSIKPHTKALHALQRLLPSRMMQKYTHRKVIEAFSAQLGLVYFGFVDQHADEHELVRGFTLSVGHTDNHYSVGSAYGYDIILVERTDVLKAPGARTQRYNWIILQIDLRSSGLPHAFFTSLSHPKVFYSHFFIKYARFQPLPASVWRNHDPLFRERFTTFSTPESAEELVRLFSLDTTATIGRYFDRFEIELQDDKLFVYLSNQPVTLASLEVLLKNGLWLAGQIDSQVAASVTQQS
ncbi:MAG TPA: hypothetical protein VD907_02875 [Verrucomicrobiae bacterium]|nr:hypothetical protein [Verrucomicrobiae bacterium]